MNNFFCIGNLTRDVEAQVTPSGVPVTRFSIAVNRRAKSQDGERQTDFFTVVTWRGLAETCGKFLSKGKKVAVVGELQNRSYEDKDGNKRYVTEIVASEVEFLSTQANGLEADSTPSNKPEQAKYEAPPSRPPKQDSFQATLEMIDADDDMPF
jgi:single-strand DNA-binding protein